MYGVSACYVKLEYCHTEVILVLVVRTLIWEITLQNGNKWVEAILGNRSAQPQHPKEKSPEESRATAVSITSRTKDQTVSWWRSVDANVRFLLASVLPIPTWCSSLETLLSIIIDKYLDLMTAAGITPTHMSGPISRMHRPALSSSLHTSPA